MHGDKLYPGQNMYWPICESSSKILSSCWGWDRPFCNEMECTWLQWPLRISITGKKEKRKKKITHNHLPGSDPTLLYNYNLTFWNQEENSLIWRREGLAPRIQFSLHKLMCRFWKWFLDTSPRELTQGLPTEGICTLVSDYSNSPKLWQPCKCLFGQLCHLSCYPVSLS